MYGMGGKHMMRGGAKKTMKKMVKRGKTAKKQQNRQQQNRQQQNRQNRQQQNWF
jgi:hypothetical protein